MARVTVEDCVGQDKTNNRFELVIMAAQRTKDIQSGSPITLPEDRDKAHVIALREIAAANVKIPDLKKKFFDRIHNKTIADNFEEEVAEASEFISEETLSFAEDEGNIALSEEEMIIDHESMEMDSDDFLEEDKNF